MKQKAKKLLAVLLCIALCATMPIAISVNAEETAAREALLNAWGNLSGEQLTTLLNIGSASGYKSTENFNAETGRTLTDAQIAAFGGYYAVAGTGANYNGVAAGNFANSPDFDTFEKISYSYYAPSWSTFLWQNGSSPSYPNGSGFQTLWADNQGNGNDGVLKGFMNGSISKGWHELKNNNNAGTVYVGALVGHNTITAAVPENAAELSAEALLAEAQKVVISDYSVGTEEFKAALKNLYEMINPEAATLITAWGNLTKVAQVTLATPNGGSPVSETNTVPGVANVAELGTHVLANQAVSGNINFTLTSGSFATADYSALYAWALGTDAEGNPVTWKENCHVNYSGTYNQRTINGLGKVNFRDRAATTVNNGVYIQFATAPAYITVGSLVGEKNVNAKVPDDVYSMTAAELLAAAEEVEGYTGNVDAFEAAKADMYVVAYPEKAALVAAWEGLTKLENIVLATPNCSGGTTITVNENTVVAGLADTSVLGTTYVEYAPVDAGWKFAHGLLDFSQYNEVYVWASAVDAEYNAVQYKLDPVVDWNSTETWPLINGWKKVSLDAGKAKDNTNVDHNSIHLRKEGGWAQNATYFSYGSVIGVQEVNVTAPEGIYTMSYEEILAAANALDLTTYGGDVDTFNAAVADIHNIVYGEANQELIDALNGVYKEEITTLLNAPSGNYVANSELPEEIKAKLTDEQLALMGGYHAVAGLATGQSGRGSGNFALAPAFNTFDKISFSFYAPQYAEFLWQIGSSPSYPGGSGFQTRWADNQGEGNDSVLKGLMDGTISKGGWHEVKDNKRVSTVYVGALVGHKNVAPVIPEGWEAMTTEELYLAVKAENDIASFNKGDVDTLTAVMADLAEQYGCAEHTYDHDCDTDCNVCGEVRPIEHKFDNDCDTTCNVEGCGYTRVTNHVFDHDCDTDCNVEGCDYTRVTNHVFDHDCDTDCNVEGCDYTRVTEHKFDHDCDTDCNVEGCDYTRVTNHVFDHDCDTDCNTVGCDYTRVTEHKYDNEFDATCNVEGCGFTRVVDEVIVEDVTGGEFAAAVNDETVTVTIAPEEGYVLKAGSLKVVNAKGEVVAVPMRAGFQSENTQAAEYTFKTTGETLKVVGEFVKVSELETPNIGNVGWQIRESDGGIRSIHRLAIEWVDGEYYTTFAEGTKKVDKFGILVATEFSNLGDDKELNYADIAEGNVVVKYFNLSSVRFDVADGYHDISVAFTGFDAYPGVKLTSRAFIEVDGEYYYTDATTKTWNQIKGIA